MNKNITLSALILALSLMTSNLQAQVSDLIQSRGRELMITDINEALPNNTDEEDDYEYVFMLVDQMPEYPGGIKALIQFISDNLQYQSVALQNGDQGRVLVRFVVTKDGSVSRATVLQTTTTEELNKEALRVVNAMPKWVAGKQNGVNVNTYFTIPIVFRLPI